MLQILSIMLQIFSIMLFGNSVKFTQLCARFTPRLNFFLFVILHIPIPHGAKFTATFLLRAKSTTFGALSLSRIEGAESASLLLYLRSTCGSSLLTHYLKMLRC